jgi:hypothetical protein
MSVTKASMPSRTSLATVASSSWPEPPSGTTARGYVYRVAPSRCVSGRDLNLDENVSPDELALWLRGLTVRS